MYTRNEPQLPRENVRSRIDRYNDRKARLLDVLPILSLSNRQKLSILLPKSLKTSKYWPTLDRRGQMNGTVIPWRTFFYRIPLARRTKNRIPQCWMIPQYRTLKSKLPKYRLKKSLILQYRKPHVPLIVDLVCFLPTRGWDLSCHFDGRDFLPTSSVTSWDDHGTLYLKLVNELAPSSWSRHLKNGGNSG